MVHIEAKSPNNRKYPPVPARTTSPPLEYNGRDSRYVAAYVAGVLCVFTLALLALAVTL